MLSRFGHVLSHTSRGEHCTLSLQGYLQLLKSLKWLKRLAVATAAKGLSLYRQGHAQRERKEYGFTRTLVREPKEDLRP